MYRNYTTPTILFSLLMSFSVIHSLAGAQDRLPDAGGGKMASIRRTFVNTSDHPLTLQFDTGSGLRLFLMPGQNTTLEFKVRERYGVTYTFDSPTANKGELTKVKFFEDGTSYLPSRPTQKEGTISGKLVNLTGSTLFYVCGWIKPNPSPHPAPSSLAPGETLTIPVEPEENGFSPDSNCVSISAKPDGSFSQSIDLFQENTAFVSGPSDDATGELPLHSCDVYPHLNGAWFTCGNEAVWARLGQTKTAPLPICLPLDFDPDNPYDNLSQNKERREKGELLIVANETTLSLLIYFRDGVGLGWNTLCIPAGGLEELPLNAGEQPLGIEAGTYSTTNQTHVIKGIVPLYGKYRAVAGRINRMVIRGEDMQVRNGPVPKEKLKDKMRGVAKPADKR